MIFQLPSIPLAGIPISYVEKAPVLSEKISVWLDMFSEGSKSVIVNLALFPVFPISKIDSPGEKLSLVVVSEIAPEPGSRPIENLTES